MGGDLGRGPIDVKARNAAGGPRVSVLMGVYNGEPYLREAVESILSQTFGDFEFVIVDDGSTDGTAAVLDSYRDGRIRLIRQEHSGLTRALNQGLRVARGEFVARQDADDVSHPERLERQVRFLEAHPEVALVGTWIRVIDQEGGSLASMHFEIEPDRIAALLPRENHFSHGSIMVRRSVLDEVGGYRDAFRYAQDYDLTLRLVRRHRLANIPEELYLLRHWADKISFRRVALQESYSKLAQRLGHERSSQGSDSLDAGYPVEELLESSGRLDELGYHRQMAYFFLRAGRVRKARKELLAILQRQPWQLRSYLYLGVSLAGPRLTPRIMRVWERLRGGSRVVQ